MGEVALGIGREVIAIETTDSPPRIPKQTRGIRFERQPKYTPRCSTTFTLGQITPASLNINYKVSNCSVMSSIHGDGEACLG